MDNAKILTADDGKVMRLVISRKLEEAGYAVCAVGSGREVVELVGREPFDLVILDIGMPEMDGIETLKRIRQRYSAVQLPVIMATAKDDDEEVIRAFGLGANDFVSKPVNFPVLFARIETHLKLKRATEELGRLARPGDDGTECQSGAPGY
jgi:DNA-binding response OmpR family regulator